MTIRFGCNDFLLKECDFEIKGAHFTDEMMKLVDVHVAEAHRTLKVSPETREKMAGVALVVGPILFVAAMGVEQALRPGFSILSNTISELGVDNHSWSYAWMFTVSIIILGLLTLVGAYGLFRVFGRVGRNGAMLLALSGLGCIGVGIFNYVGYLVLHSIFALDQFIMSGLAPLFLALVLGKDPKWGPTYAKFSRLCGIIILISTVLFLMGVAGPGYNGLVERMVVTPALLWSVITGLRLSRLR